jgi:hypothetical protein
MPMPESASSWCDGLPIIAGLLSGLLVLCSMIWVYLLGRE